VKSLRSIQELIFPNRCIGCSALGLEICSQCRRSWHPHIYRSWSHSAPHFPIYSAIPYSPIAGKVILSAKENGILNADRLIVGALIHALRYCIEENGEATLVPIPSRKSVARLRGRQFITELSRQLSRETGLTLCENLRHTRVVKDQSSLDARSRFANIDGALISQKFFSGKAFLIDDLVTTGATLNEAARALRMQGIEVAAAVTACVAEPLR
jgi:predicted amidophosphoribosyltransferase